MITQNRKVLLEEKARIIRKNVIEMTWRAQSGHPGGSLSLAEIMSVLYFEKINFDPQNPDWPERDRVIVSKGHAAPVWYATLAEVGVFDHQELWKLRQIDALLEGHPCIHIPGIEATTGSLGLGLSAGCGMALAAKMKKMNKVRIYVILGDGELGEGQVWEAAMAASHFKLNNITAILDLNGYQNDGATQDILNLGSYFDKWKSFGWNTINIDGHNIDQLVSAFDLGSECKDKPTMIIANTIKGCGASYLIDKPELHYSPPSDEQRNMALKELGF